MNKYNTVLITSVFAAFMGAAVAQETNTTVSETTTVDTTVLKKVAQPPVVNSNKSDTTYYKDGIAQKRVQQTKIVKKNVEPVIQVERTRQQVTKEVNSDTPDTTTTTETTTTVK